MEVDVGVADDKYNDGDSDGALDMQTVAIDDGANDRLVIDGCPEGDIYDGSGGDDITDGESDGDADNDGEVDDDTKAVSDGADDMYCDGGE